MKYKLMLFGFSALCEDVDEVNERLRQTPARRGEYETFDQCYLIDLKSGKNYPICRENGMLVVEWDSPN